MRKGEQGHSAALTVDVRAFDNVEEPSTLGERSTFSISRLEGSRRVQLTHSTPRLEPEMH